MIKNYLLIFVRNILRYKTFSLINVFGLTLGIACFMVIILFAEFEFSYDKFHSGSENMFRIVKDFVNSEGGRIPDANTPPALSTTLRSNVPEVEAVTRFVINGGRRNLFEYSDKQFYELELLRIDSSFFQVFDFEFVRGSKDRPFRNIHSMVLTESLANKYFGNEDPIGKVIKTNINSQTDFEVTAVVKDVPENSHFTFRVLIPFESRQNIELDWNRHFFYTYAKLKPNSDRYAFEAKVKDIVKRNNPQTLDEYYIQSIEDIHLTSRLKSELEPNGDLQYVRILIIIGVFVLVIAGINYVNLTTAQSMKRAKEVGVRKVTGAFRLSLIHQFLFESLAVAVVSSVFAITLVSFVLPYIVFMVGTDLSALLFTSSTIRFVIPASVAGIGILAGIYPAFYLSSFRPLSILRGKMISSPKGIRLRQGLVVFQFVVSGSLIIGFLIIRQQIDFIQNKDLGFNQHAVLTVANVIGIANPEAIAEDFRKVADVQSVGRASGGILGLRNSMNGVGDMNSENHISLNFMRTDYDFIPTLDINVIEGRNFSPAFRSDSTAIILNQEAVTQLGLQEPILGQTISWDDEVGVMHDVQIIGVVRDFHFTSFHEQIKPFGFILEVNNGSTFYVKMSGRNIAATLTALENVWKKHSPDRPFDYVFQDEYTAKLHVAEERFQNLFSSFTVLAIAVACLGLLGLVTALSEVKTKEIGIRKVLGSSVTGIVGLLTKEFVGLVLIAFVVAAPLSYYVMHAWLEGFAYHVEIEWQVFAVAAVTTVMIAMTTVCFQSIKAALANPVNSLRSE